MYQPHEMIEEPIEITIDSIDPKGKGSLKRVDDKIYFRSLAHITRVSIEFGIGAFLIGLWLFLSVESSEQYLVPVLFLIGGLFWSIYGIFVNKKHKLLELNRLDGTITYPDRFFNPPLKGQFKDLKTVISVSGNIDGYADTEYLKFANTFKPRKVDFLYTLYASDPRKEWSFMVWYMDKNRPLPPGTAFDPYREKDYQRRKAEGFPKPLYKSRFETPEATPEQQKERKRIGGW